MEVEIISEEIIKPSSPTPLHLKDHRLSFLDIHFGSNYVPLILYYPMNQNKNLSPSDSVSKRLRVLKQSLSETLSSFYPFAGKKKDMYSIDCNDEGVYFVEAKVNSPLNNFLSNLNISLISKFLPDKAKWKPLAPGDCIAGVQVTIFDCGGIVVGVYVSHLIADGTAFGSFLKSWSSTARKSTKKNARPKFDSSTLFPHNHAYPKEVVNSNPQESLPKRGRWITRRYVFDASAIAKLKAMASGSCEQTPTRVGVVAAFFTKFMKALRFGSDKPLSIAFPVNLRRRAIPQFSEYNMGNFIWTASMLWKDKQVELPDFVCQMKDALAKLNGDFVNSLQGEGGWANYLIAAKCSGENCSDLENRLGFGSWCNFGFYDVDFGWGKPLWVSIPALTEMGTSAHNVLLMDTRHKDGIEAWTYFLEEDVAMLERDKEFLAFVTVNPSPLNII